jgi:hypothetical protein
MLRLHKIGETKMVRATALVVIAALVAGPATAGNDFASYDGKDAITEGKGGTKVVTDGVEFWTSGAPPQHYRILGILTDTRGGGLLSGSATGSSVAKHIKTLGGDAAIVLGHDSQIRGAMVLSNGMVAIAKRNTTQLLVVKYEDTPELR